MNARAPLPVWVIHVLLRVVRNRRRMPGAVATGVALGLMRRSHLHDLDRLHYDHAAFYTSEAHNLSGLTSWEQTAVAEWFRGCRSLVVIGAGAGREVLALARMGFDVDGYECNAHMVRTAAALLPAHGCDAHVFPLARDTAPPPQRTYDGLIVGWGAYMMIPGRAARVRFLTDLAALARPGAPILVSFFTRAVGDARLQRIAAIATRLRRLRRAEAVEPGDDLALNYVHRFSEDEVRSELRAAGFEPMTFTPQGPGPMESGWAVGRLA